MTRVIHVITASLIAGGMEAFLARLAPALGRKGFAGEITVLPHFAAPEQAPRVERRLFDTPEDVPLILALGRFDRLKGFDIALRAPDV